MLPTALCLPDSDWGHDWGFISTGHRIFVLGRSGPPNEDPSSCPLRQLVCPAPPLSLSIPRALPNAPDGYAPANVSLSLATRPSIRSAGGSISNIPNIAIAVSGGGYRAMTSGAGALKAFDSRTDNSTAKGQLGDLLRSATCVSGLSGGGWLLGSIVVNNFATVSALQADRRSLSTASYWKHLIKAVDAKEEASYNTSITDYWGRALSHQFISSTTDDGGIGHRHQLHRLRVQAPGDSAWDPSVYHGFLRHWNSSALDSRTAELADDEVRAGFTARRLRHGHLLVTVQPGSPASPARPMPPTVKDTMYQTARAWTKNGRDIAVYSPNPFYPLPQRHPIYAQQRDLDVVDGGGQSRTSLSASSDPARSPCRRRFRCRFHRGHQRLATAIHSSIHHERSLSSTGIVSPSPPIHATPPPPQDAGTPTRARRYHLNGYNVVTRGQFLLGGRNRVSAARSSLAPRERTGTTLPKACQTCFKNYCWNGTVDSQNRRISEPELQMEEAASSALPAGI
ncbi:Lysophospholipase 1 [Aspergillus tanneri]|uniref:Lysophospholipase n=1 Tax=Aspergillus tanneri TaxID=1220188 RepID=A0A5M9M3E9_9EURO|nr:Lysophospholipase 1 [Aspergillus tanneri]KAA8641268.1 Lysophospholipase 1 [Aspergillus tanneri]